jgi:hypothetical protein
VVTACIFPAQGYFIGQGMSVSRKARYGSCLKKLMQSKEKSLRVDIVAVLPDVLRIKCISCIACHAVLRE